jgi:D-lactate dehydrogenase (cytochrome)
MSIDLPSFPLGKNTAIYWEFAENQTSSFESELDLWESMLGRFGSSLESTWSGTTENEIEKLKTFRHAVPEAINARIAQYKREYPGIRKISTDCALPSQHFESKMAQWGKTIIHSGIEHAIFGHLGDFHLHINLIPHNQEGFDCSLRIYEEIMQDAIACGGTISAEHGIGKIKTSSLRKMYGNNAIEEMKRIKTSLDPNWLLNRGNLFDFK